MKFLQVWEIKNYGNNNFFWYLCSSYDQFIGEHFRSTRLRQAPAKISWICQSLVCLATIGGQRLPNSIKSVTNQCTLFVFHRSGYNQILKNGTKNDCFAFNCWPSKGITTKSRFWDEHHNKYNLLVAPR